MTLMFCRVMLVLNLFDKIDNNKLTPEAHFLNDLGLDSLDHVEIMLMIEVSRQTELLLDVMLGWMLIWMLVCCRMSLDSRFLMITASGW